MAKSFKIDAEFSALLPSPDRSALEAQCLADGRIREPLVLWQRDAKTLILLDGHGRNSIATKHKLKLPSPIIFKFETRQEAFNWIIDNQRARRNITEDQDKYLLGKRYQIARLPTGKPNVDKVSTLKKEEVAEKEGVSDRTLRRAADFAEAVDDAPKAIAEAVKGGELTATTAQLEAVAELPAAEKRKVIKAVESGEVETLAEALKEVESDEPDNSDTTIEERMEVWNRLVESFARKITAVASDAPRGPHLDETRLNILRDALKSAASGVRAAKGHAVCTYCEGKGCKPCRKTGYLTKNAYDSSPGAVA